ncbi:MAG: hypothetical protein ACI9YU_002243 [Flavobacteriales bacterium]|jgi:hypothetical protein
MTQQELNVLLNFSFPTPVDVQTETFPDNTPYQPQTSYGTKG